MNNSASSETVPTHGTSDQIAAQPMTPSANNVPPTDPTAQVAVHAAPASTGKQVVNWLQTTQGVIAGIAAVLVILPSLINAVLDIYVTLFNVPRTLSEQYNQELFQKHFQKQPIHTGSSVIKTKEGAELAIKLSVYENGDIYVEYGNYSQWFPFKSSDESSAALDWLIPPAYAEAVVKNSPCLEQLTSADPEAKPPRMVDSFGAMHYYTQTDIPLTKRTFKRVRLYDDGCQEVLTIDINSGEILTRELNQKALPPDEKQAMRKKAIQLFAPQVIDIQKIQQQPVLDLNSLSNTTAEDERTEAHTLGTEPAPETDSDAATPLDAPETTEAAKESTDTNETPPTPADE